MLRSDVVDAGIDLAIWRTWTNSDASVIDVVEQGISDAWKKAVEYDDWKEPSPYLGHLADALTPLYN